MGWTAPSHFGSADAHGVATCSIVASANAGDIIILGVQTDRSTTGIASTITTAAGLTWQKYEGFAFQPPSSFFGTTDLWWAVAPSGLSAQTITAALSGGGNFDAMALIYASFPNVNTSTPWDTNGSLPATGNSGTAGAAKGTFSTTAPNTCAIVLLAAVTGALQTGQTPTTGSTEVAYISEASGTFWATLYMGYQCFTAAQSGAQIGITQTPQQDATWVIGALVQAASGPPPSGMLFAS